MCNTGKYSRAVCSLDQVKFSVSTRSFFNTVSRGINTTRDQQQCPCSPPAYNTLEFYAAKTTREKLLGL